MKIRSAFESDPFRILRHPIDGIEAITDAIGHLAAYCAGCQIPQETCEKLAISGADRFGVPLRPHNLIRDTVTLEYKRLKGINSGQTDRRYDFKRPVANAGSLTPSRQAAACVAALLPCYLHDMEYDAEAVAIIATVTHTTSRSKPTGIRITIPIGGDKEIIPAFAPHFGHPLTWVTNAHKFAKPRDLGIAFWNLVTVIPTRRRTDTDGEAAQLVHSIRSLAIELPDEAGNRRSVSCDQDFIAPMQGLASLLTSDGKHILVVDPYKLINSGVLKYNFQFKNKRTADVRDLLLAAPGAFPAKRYAHPRTRGPLGTNTIGIDLDAFDLALEGVDLDAQRRAAFAEMQAPFEAPAPPALAAVDASDDDMLADDTDGRYGPKLVGVDAPQPRRRTQDR